MRSTHIYGLCLILAWGANSSAQEVIWKAAGQLPLAQTGTSVAAPASAVVTLGMPTPLSQSAPSEAPGWGNPAGPIAPRLVRGQVPDPPPAPAPAFPGAPPPGAPYYPGPSANPYNTGVVNNDSDLGGFWTKLGDNWKRCWDDVTGNAGNAFQSTTSHKPFQSDHDFDGFSSPVTNPFYFVDPRALTEIRPVFIWQHTPDSNPVFHGGNDYVFALSGSVAFTQNISLVINKIGLYSIHPEGNDPDVSAHTGFSDIMLGPKFTFLRSETSKTVAAIGLTFDIPAGSSNNLQNTGHLMLDPYISIAQNFGASKYGSFNFMNTTGYTFATDNTRSEAFYSSFHLDYDVGAFKRFFPFIEINWWLYTRSGGNEPFNFDGSNLANFGSEHVAGLSELTLAFGTRVVINNFIQWGIGLEFNTIGDSSRHLDQFRLTTDFIFRY